jgi:hypothetical protein
VPLGGPKTAISCSRRGQGTVVANEGNQTGKDASVCRAPGYFRWSRLSSDGPLTFLSGTIWRKCSSVRELPVPKTSSDNTEPKVFASDGLGCSSKEKGIEGTFGWLQASATKISFLSPTSANPATIRICMPIGGSKKLHLKESSWISRGVPWRSCTHRDPPISDGRGAAVDIQLHSIHEARIF